MTDFRTLWNPSSLSATKLLLGLTKITSLGSKTASVSPSLKIGRSEMLSVETKTKFLNHSFEKISAFCDAHPLYLIYIYSQGQQSVICSMSDQSDSQNKSAEQIHMSEGTSPSST